MEGEESTGVSKGEVASRKITWALGKIKGEKDKEDSSRKATPRL
jgi:hypothetical protein